MNEIIEIIVGIKDKKKNIRFARKSDKNCKKPENVKKIKNGDAEKVNRLIYLTFSSVRTIWLH